MQDGIAQHRTTHGFTIVELLIVIVVIGILAAITIVAYSGIQQRANDSLRRDSAAKLMKAYAMHIADGGNPRLLGCGSNDNGNGFLLYVTASEIQYEGPTCVDRLATLGYINADFTERIPPNTAYANKKDRMFMLYYCSQAPYTRGLLLWFLDEPTESETQHAEHISLSCTGSSNIAYSQYGMRAAEMLTW